MRFREGVSCSYEGNILAAENGLDFGDGFLFTGPLGIIHQDAKAVGEVMFGKSNDLRTGEAFLAIGAVNENEIEALVGEDSFNVLVRCGENTSDFDFCQRKATDVHGITEGGIHDDWRIGGH